MKDEWPNLTWDTGCDPPKFRALIRPLFSSGAGLNGPHVLLHKAYGGLGQ